MKKNVASQVVDALLISKTDGSAVTSGTTSVFVSGDGGPQVAAGGSPSCTHLGNGLWSYIATAGESNYDHVSFTFVNSSAINVNIQIYTTYPQTGDNFARIGAPAGASLAADVAAVKTDTAAIKVQTDKMTFTVANHLDVNTLKWNGGTIPAPNVTGVPLVDMVYVLGTISPAAPGSVRADAGDPLAVAVPGAYSAGSLGYVIGHIPTAIENADALLDRNMATGTDSGTDGGSPQVRTPRQAFRFMRNRVYTSSGTQHVTKEDDTTDSWTAAVTTDAGALPIIEINPAG